LGDRETFIKEGEVRLCWTNGVLIGACSWGVGQAEVHPKADGTCDIVLHLQDGEGPFHARGFWREVLDGNYFLTAVRISPVCEQSSLPYNTAPPSTPPPID